MSTLKVISQMPILVFQGIADDLENLLRQGLVFEEPDEEARKYHFVLLKTRPALHNPARFYVQVLVEVTCSRKEQLTDKDIGQLISETRVLVKSLTKILDLAAEEAKKKPRLTRKHLQHTLRNGALGGKIIALKRPELIHFARKHVLQNRQARTN